jgi:hypothetical protein
MRMVRGSSASAFVLAPMGRTLCGGNDRPPAPVTVGGTVLGLAGQRLAEQASWRFRSAGAVLSRISVIELRCVTFVQRNLFLLDYLQYHPGVADGHITATYP